MNLHSLVPTSPFYLLIRLPLVKNDPGDPRPITWSSTSSFSYTRASSCLFVFFPPQWVVGGTTCFSLQSTHSVPTTLISLFKSDFRSESKTILTRYSPRRAIYLPFCILQLDRSPSISHGFVSLQDIPFHHLLSLSLSSLVQTMG